MISAVIICCMDSFKKNTNSAYLLIITSLNAFDVALMLNSFYIYFLFFSNEPLLVS